MKKNINIKILLFTLIIPLFSIFAPYSTALADTDEILSIDNSAYINSLPRGFRKCSDKVGIVVNTKGLDKLNISGSSQFSRTGLKLIKENLQEEMPITIFDLREESHGFINGIPISWENNFNNANRGLSKEEIINKENNLLQSIKVGEKITLNPVGTIDVEAVENEDNLCKTMGYSYVRLPVTDGTIPTPETVQKFVKLVKNQPNNTWLHFHCKAGIGRTTTFMILYDIMKNYNEVPLMDIITREVFLGQLSEGAIRDFTTGRRLEFFTKFYNNCKENKLSNSNYKLDTIVAYKAS